MGTLEDAIRAHIELKRSHGATEDELTQIEQDALLNQPPLESPAPSSDEIAVDIEQTYPEPVSVNKPEPTFDTEQQQLAEQKVDQAQLEVDEPNHVATEEASSHENQPETKQLAPKEKISEQPPELFEATPEHDRLWFEQKAPEDFDFND